MRSTLAISLFALLAAAQTSAAYGQGAQSQPQISISPDRDVVVQGEPFKITIRVSTRSEGEPRVVLPSFGKLRVINKAESHPMSFQFSFGTGQGSQRITKRDSIYEFTLVADQPGKYKLNPVVVELQGQRYKSKAYSINVSASATGQVGQALSQLPPGQATVDIQEPPPPETVKINSAVDPDFFIDMAVSKDNVYAGEMLTLTLYLYTTRSYVRAGITREPGTEGFWAETIDTGRGYGNRSQVSVDGKYYERVELRKLALFPLKAGEFTIAPAIAELELRSGFFGSKKVRRTAKPLKVNVEPLPREDMPEGFSKSNVGKFSFRVYVDNSKVKVGEPVMVKMAVKGTGNLHNVVLPELTEMEGFKVYDPEVKTDVNADAVAVRGSKVSETLMIPRKAGTFSIPSLALSYFDPEDKAYRTQKSKPYAITVSPGDVEADAPASGAGTETETKRDNDLERLNKGLRSIVSNSDLTRGSNALPFTRPWFVAPVILAPLCFIALLVISGYRKRARRNLHKGRSKRAQSTAERALSSLEKDLEDTPSAQFFAGLQKVLLTFLDDRLETPVAGDTMAELSQRLKDRGVSEDIAKRTVAELEGCEFARFAKGTSDAEERKKATDRIRDLVDALNKAPIEPPAKEDDQ